MTSAACGDERSGVALRAVRRTDERLPRSLPPLRSGPGRLPHVVRGVDRTALARGALAACCLQIGVIAGSGYARMPPPPADRAIELVVEAPAPAPAPQPDETAEETPPPAAAPPALPSPPQPDAAPEPPPPAAVAAPALEPPIRAPAIRTRSELRRILTPPSLVAPNPQIATAQPPSSVAAPQAAEPRASPAASSPAASSAEATFEGRVREAIQAALRVPPAARMMGLSGRARVRLGYRDGSLASAGIDLSTGSSLLDDAALRATRDAAYPSPPPELEHRLLTYLVWVQISVR